MKIEGKEYRTIWFDQQSQIVKIIDQTKLPHQFIVKDLKTVKDAINAIKAMEVRGAPLIGGTAAYGIVLAALENSNFNFIKKSSEDLIKSRPTAINLKWAVDRMIKRLSKINSDQIINTALDEAKDIKNIEIVEELALPPVKIHCSVLAEDAIKSAISDYQGKNPNDSTGNYHEIKAHR